MEGFLVLTLQPENSSFHLYNILSFAWGHAHGVGVESLIINKFPIFTQIYFRYGLNMNKTFKAIDSLLYQLGVVLFESPLFCQVSE